MGLPGSLERMHELVRNAAYPSFFAPVVPFEREAVRIHGFELGSVPGLLQTETYARALIRATRPHDKDADESVLRRVVGSRAVMAEQIDRLITAASGRDTVIQVLTFADGEGVGSDGPISVYEFSGARACVTPSATGAGE